MSAELVPFSFNGCQVRTVTINGEPRLVASDVCAFLGFMNSRQAVANHVIPEDRLRSTNSIPDNPNLLIVNSSELYASAISAFRNASKRNTRTPPLISPDTPSFWCYGLLPSNPTPRRDEVVAFQKVQPAALSNP